MRGHGNGMASLDQGTPALGKGKRERGKGNASLGQGTPSLGTGRRRRGKGPESLGKGNVPLGKGAAFLGTGIGFLCPEIQNLGHPGVKHTLNRPKTTPPPRQAALPEPRGVARGYKSKPGWCWPLVWALGAFLKVSSGAGHGSRHGAGRPSGGRPAEIRRWAKAKPRRS